LSEHSPGPFPGDKKGLTGIFGRSTIPIHPQTTTYSGFSAEEY